MRKGQSIPETRSIGTLFNIQERQSGTNFCSVALSGGQLPYKSVSEPYVLCHIQG